MQKLKYVLDSGQQVIGNIIERDSSGYVLNRYNNMYGSYCQESCTPITNKQTLELLAQNDLRSRIQKLHSFFKDAEYIAADVIFSLNFNREDIFTALKGYLTF